MASTQAHWFWGFKKNKCGVADFHFQCITCTFTVLFHNIKIKSTLFSKVPNTTPLIQYILSELKRFWETIKRWCVTRSQMLPDQTNHLQISEPSLTETIKFKSWFHAFTFSTSIYRLSSHENSQATCCRPNAFIIKLQTKVYLLAWQQIKHPARKSSLQGNGDNPTKCQNHGVIWTCKMHTHQTAL